jgi:hypothetical protein
VTVAGLAGAALIGAVAWGAFAFGAVYPWAYWPLAIVAQAVALVGLCVPAPSPLPRLGLSPLAIALGCFLLAGTIQLVPLPLGIIRAVSPDAPGVIAQLDPLVAAGLATTHPLSLSPRSTLRGLAVLGSLAFLVIGGARLFSIAGARRSAQAIALVGVVLALVGIVQRPLHSGKIYGFWTPAGGGNPFGPFVNKNHFAGWMLMALPLTLGVAGAAAARSLRRAEMDLRARVLWLSSPEASRIVLWIAASALMALSVILTLSRSGIVVLALVAMLMAARALRSQQTTGRRIAALVVASALAIGIVAWIGVDVIAARFGEANWDDLNDRQGAWLDAVRIIRLYPLAGTGFNTYGVATLFYQQHNLFWHYAQAHNDYLQLAADGGLLLGVPALVCLALFGAIVWRRFREETSLSTSWIRFGAVTGIVAVALQDTVDFSLQMPGNALLFAVLCAIAVHRTPERRRAA